MRNILLALFVLLFFNSCRKYELALSLEKGETYTFISENEIEITQKVDNNLLTISSKITSRMDFFVEKIDKGLIDIDAKYSNFKMFIKTPYGNRTLSSETIDSTNYMSLAMNLMKNFPIKLTLNKFGEVVKVKNLDVFYKSVLGLFPNISNYKKEQAIEEVKKTFGEQALKSNIETLTAIFPRKKVKVNQTWQIPKKTLGGSISAHVTTVYKLNKVNDSCFEISGTSKITPDANPKTTNVSGTKVKYQLRGSMASSIKIYRESGWVKESKIVQKVAGKAIYKTTKEIEIPVLMDNITTITGVK